jgi:hypothetical protein
MVWAEPCRMCVAGGQERTEEEYAGLLARAGWRYVKTWYAASRLMSIVEAVKA